MNSTLVSEKMKIPFVDLKAQYNTIKAEINHAIEKTISETDFIRGKSVAAFEKQFAEDCGMKHCIGVANGTDAIYIVLKMLGIGEGDEVITVANSWISTSETITQSGARAVFVDTEPDYFSIDVNKIEEKINSKTKAIIPVHIYGQPAEVEKIKALCEKHKLHLIEDCAQSHFAKINNQLVGSFGVAATYSFYPGKNLGAYGDAGAVTTNDDDLAKKIRMYANHGALIKHQHEMEGVNSRLDGLHAAILSAKLPYVQQWNNARAANAKYLTENLKDIKQIQCPEMRPGNSHIFHIYCIKAERRSELQKFLKENEIETAIHYPTPMPFMNAYKYMGHTEKDFPVCAANMNRILSLPMFPEMTKEQMDYVIAKIKSFYNN